jgi:transcriptional regulator GlxA family with amidase domain
MTQPGEPIAGLIGPHPERVVGVLAYDGAHLLNIAGPCEVFAAANRVLMERGATLTAMKQPGYRVRAFSAVGGIVTTASGIEINTHPFPTDETAFDTLIIPGGAGIRSVMADSKTLAWLKQCAMHARRIASFGGGTFILARAGLLDGKRCVTHWRFEEDLRREYPEVKLVTDSLFVRDGNCLTAAGSSASVDLTIQMIEEDFGKALAVDVARMLVVSHVRPGEQPQFSAELKAQGAAAPRIAIAAEWMVSNIQNRPTVSTVAERFAMSERNFSRAFTRDMGMSPQRFVEQARLETARRWLASSELPIEKVARHSGFSSGEHLTQTFKKLMGMAPGAYRARTRDNAAASA